MVKSDIGKPATGRIGKVTFSVRCISLLTGNFLKTTKYKKTLREIKSNAVPSKYFGC
jgi:hypothetical protein